MTTPTSAPPSFCPTCGAALVPGEPCASCASTAGSAAVAADLYQNVYGSHVYAPPAGPGWGRFAPKSHLVLAVVSIFFCWPIGGFAIWSATRVERRFYAGDHAGAYRAARRAAVLGVVAIVVGSVLGVVVGVNAFHHARTQLRAAAAAPAVKQISVFERSYLADRARGDDLGTAVTDAAHTLPAGWAVQRLDVDGDGEAGPADTVVAFYDGDSTTPVAAYSLPTSSVYAPPVADPVVDGSETAASMATKPNNYLAN